jgi:hypothetical protein
MKEFLAKKKEDFQNQINQTESVIQNATAKIEQLKGAIYSLEIVAHEWDKQNPPPKTDLKAETQEGA